jgi:hypothetical protein
VTSIAFHRSFSSQERSGKYRILVPSRGNRLHIGHCALLLAWAAQQLARGPAYSRFLVQIYTDGIYVGGIFSDDLSVPSSSSQMDCLGMRLSQNLVQEMTFAKPVSSCHSILSLHMMARSFLTSGSIGIYRSYPNTLHLERLGTNLAQSKPSFTDAMSTKRFHSPETRQGIKVC